MHDWETRLFGISQLTNPNYRNGANCWNDFSGFCLGKECGRHLRAEEGLFCANFSARRGGFAPCEGAWCGPCYKPLGIRNFPIRQKLDDDGEILEEADKATRFNEGRAGDHLMVPFQCELCHYRNMILRLSTR